MTTRSHGFSMITVLLWMVLLGLVSLLLHVRLSDQLESLPASERQLYSLVMAQNGIEFARSRLPGLEIDALLLGPDGVQGGTAAEWRNPLPWALARTGDPLEQLLAPDDGLPPQADGGVMDRAYRGAGEGYFFLRFSNNPEEPPDQDRDGIVLVRSLGVSRSRLPAMSLGRELHPTTLIEARLRQERVFELESALTLFCDQGRFRWTGSGFAVWGGAESAVSLLTHAGSTLRADLEDSLAASQRPRIGGSPRQWHDATPAWRTDAKRQRVFDRVFWTHLAQHVPEFADPTIPGLRYLPEGGVIRGDLRGIVIARGELRIAGHARVTGLLLHLGEGSLRLADEAIVRGGVWMSSFNEAAPGAGRIELEMGGQASIIFDAAAVREALRLIPPTSLGWRLLSPEMAL